MKTNLNTLASKISELEGKREQMDIANIKETIACIGKFFRSCGLLKSICIFIAIYRNAGK